MDILLFCLRFEQCWAAVNLSQIMSNFALGRKGQFLLLKYILKGQLFDFRKGWWFKPSEIFSKWLFLYDCLSRFSVFYRPQMTLAGFPVWFLASESFLSYYSAVWKYLFILMPFSFSQGLLYFICVECVRISVWSQSALSP